MTDEWTEELHGDGRYPEIEFDMMTDFPVFPCADLIGPESAKQAANTAPPPSRVSGMSPSPVCTGGGALDGPLLRRLSDEQLFRIGPTGLEEIGDETLNRRLDDAQRNEFECAFENTGISDEN